MAQAILAIRNLAVRYGEATIITVPSLKVWEGEILAIMGPNGAGKSTLLRVLGLLEAPTEGEVFFKGKKVDFRSKDLLALRRRIATVFQEPLLVDATVYGNVALGLKLRGIKGQEVEQKVAEWLTRLGIAHLKDRPARTLSGGEAQRTSLARAFVLKPDLLLLDEPFSALDQPTREALLADLKAILLDTRTTAVFVTHDRDEALILGSRVAVMLGGKILQLGVPENVYAFPVDEDVARFVGVETIFPGRVVSEEEGVVVVELEGTRVEVRGECPLGERVLVCVRPEDVVLARKEEARASSARNRLPGRVIQVTPFGSFYRITVDCGVPVVALITKASSLALDLKEGTEVVASFKATAAHLIRKPLP